MSDNGIHFTAGVGFAPSDREDRPCEIVARLQSFVWAMVLDKAAHAPLAKYLFWYKFSPVQEGGQVRFVCGRQRSHADGCTCADREERINNFMWSVGLDPVLGRIAGRHELVIRGPSMMLPNIEGEE